MIPRYRVAAERIRAEVQALAQVVKRTEDALKRAKKTPQDQDFYLASAALDMHGFYSGVERLLELIASTLDAGIPSGRQWHRDLLAQMSLEVPGVRRAVLSEAARSALSEYLEFRHVVRNVYTFNLRPERVAELVGGLGQTYALAGRDLLAFCDFLDSLASADEA